MERSNPYRPGPRQERSSSPSGRPIFLARSSLISVCRGTLDVRPVVLTKIE